MIGKKTWKRWNWENQISIKGLYFYYTLTSDKFFIPENICFRWHRLKICLLLSIKVIKTSSTLILNQVSDRSKVGCRTSSSDQWGVSLGSRSEIYRSIWWGQNLVSAARLQLIPSSLSSNIKSHRYELQ